MTVLAFDTATSSCAIAIWRNGEVIAQVQKDLERGHAEVLVPMIEGVLAEAKITYQDLDLLAVTIGPGAFTGIRIGLATARSLALAIKLPLIGITNFKALAYARPQSEKAGRKSLIVLEKKRADFYVCLYDEDLTLLSEPKAVDAIGLQAFAGIGPLLLLGDAAERALPLLDVAGRDVTAPISGRYVEPVTVAQLAEDIINSGVAFSSPSPLYIKPPDVNMSGVLIPPRIFT